MREKDACFLAMGVRHSYILTLALTLALTKSPSSMVPIRKPISTDPGAKIMSDNS